MSCGLQERPRHSKGNVGADDRSPKNGANRPSTKSRSERTAQPDAIVRGSYAHVPYASTMKWSGRRCGVFGNGELAGNLLLLFLRR
jgi:hypothetical protein